MRQKLTPEQRDTVDAIAWLFVREGYLTDEQIVDEIAALMDENEGLNDIRPLITHAVDQYSTKHAKRQKRWGTPTDCDKLEEVGEELESEGVVFRVMPWCCENCALAGIFQEIKGLAGDSQVKGFAYCHREDIHDALNEGVLQISFGTSEGCLDDDALVGESIVYALRDAGLEPEWDGDATTRIRLVNFVWRMRRESVYS